MPESPADKSMLTQSQTRMPLNGLTVLDLTLARAGPTACGTSPTGAPTSSGSSRPPTDGEDVAGSRHGFDFQNLHRNKRAMTLNLKIAGGPRGLHAPGRKAPT